MNDLVGRYLVGRYLLVDPIGAGGMGSVWRAWDARLRRYVAAKLLRPADASSLLRFVREQSLRVEHPHVLAPTAWAAENDQVLLTMDLVRGGSVANLLADHGALPLSYVAVLLDQLLDALVAVHANGIVHRDIKPSNLLLEPTGRHRPVLRLADFGIAAVLDAPRLTHTRFALGTPAYMAPECASGAEPDPRQDLYAVAMVAVHLLTGQAPVGPLFGDWPGPVRMFIDALSAASPADRPESAATALREWRAVVERAGIAPLVSPGAIEIPERLGPLPPGFGPNGPDAKPPVTSPPPAVERRRLVRPATVAAAVAALALAVGVPLALSARHGETLAGSAQPRQTNRQTTTTTTTTTTTRSTTPPATGTAATTEVVVTTTERTPDPPASTVTPVDDSFSVSTTDGCGAADYVDRGQGAPGVASLDSVTVHDYCPDGHGVKAWVKLDGTALSNRYNGNSQDGAPVTWNPFGTLKAGQRITVSVCLVDGSTHNPPAKCAEHTVTLADD
jgi:serine/threonine protein kinase